jgi:ubiquinone biosynthesis protein COQ9
MGVKRDEFPAVALAVADELETLRRSCDELQELISRALRGGGFASAAIMELQAADVLMQTLQELSKFLRAYAWESQRRPDLALESAVGSIVLGALATRLSTVTAEV